MLFISNVQEENDVGKREEMSEKGPGNKFEAEGKGARKKKR